MKKKGIILIVLLVITFIGLVISAYYLYTSLQICNDESCFTNSLSKCAKTTYVKDDGTNIIQYNILGKSQGECKVNVQMLQIKSGSAELSVLEGSEMTCLLQLGLVVDPAKTLKNCHGILKEEIQNIIIQRMHAQIVQNIGKISEETTKII